jgi:uncharacterized protein involved in response to NO
MNAHIPIPRYRTWAGPAVLAQGFRPFFLAAAVWAMAAPALLVAWLAGVPGLMVPADPIAWHAHEMIFGMAGAALAGFLLTAVPNWTGRLPLQGWPLAALFAAWLAARAGAALLAGGTDAALAAVLILSFPVALLAVIAREIAAGRNWRNLPVLLGVGIFLAAEATFVAAQAGLLDGDGTGRRLGIAVFAVLICLIGGRITPSFTTNWLKRRGGEGLPAARRPVDIVALASTLAALLTWALVPEHAVVPPLAILAALANLVRLAGWQGWRVAAEPLLWGLHLGYLWVIAGLALLAAVRLGLGGGDTLVLHAFGAGAMGTMILTVMARATLGHTGRVPEATPGLGLAVVLASVGAAGRIAALLLPDLAMPLLAVAVLAWAGGFAAFLSVCGPMLVRPRVPATMQGA